MTAKTQRKVIAAVEITDNNSYSSNRLEYNKISARIRIQLKQFENEMSQLDKKLQILGRNRSITEQERERRMRQLEVLASKKVQLDSRFQNTPGSSSRAQLFEAAGRNTKLFDDDDSDEPMLENVNIEALRSEQTQILKQQDDGLENLAQVIARQKKIAMRIGDEIEDHNEIIENIAVQMDNTAERVNAETRHVELVSAKDSTWSYWLVIICLFLAIIVVGIL